MGHFAFSWDAKGYAFGVFDVGLGHVVDYAGAFACEVDSDFLEASPSVLQRLEVAQHLGV